MEWEVTALDGSGRARKVGSRKKAFTVRRRDLALLALSAPALILFLIFSYLPIPGVYAAFMRLRFDTPFFLNQFVGFKNFSFLFASADAWRITRNTLGLNFAFIVFGISIAILFALLLHEILSKRAVKAYQTVMFFPYFLSWVVVSYVLYVFLSENYGLINSILQFFGLAKVKWYITPGYWPGILIFMNVWKYVGYNCVIFYGGIMGIDPEYYDAAAVDGATKKQMMTRITLPLLTPLIVMLTLLAVGRIFYADFGMFYFLPKNMGMLYPTTDVIDTYVFRSLMATGNLGLAAAAGLYQSICGLLLVLASNFVVKKINPENAIF